MSDDVKPYTLTEVREIAAEYAKGDLILNGNERRKYRRDVAQRAFHRLVQTVEVFATGMVGFAAEAVTARSGRVADSPEKA